MTRPGEAGTGDALRQGAARLMRAPAVLAGTILLAALFTVPAAAGAREALWRHAGSVWSLWLLGCGPLVVAAWDYARAPWVGSGELLRALVFWSLVSGGVIDRYARDRPTRGRGFFAACGGHAPAMLRLALVALALNGGLALWLYPRVDSSRGVFVVLTAVLFAISAAITYAQVRIVIEDRRSAIGAVLAAVRFVRRNPAALVLHALLAAACGALKLALVNLLSQTGDLTMVGVGAAEALIVGQYALILLSWAAAATLFQSRLAHASYTAGPPLEWPDNPAAEAIANGAAQRQTR